MGEEHLYDKERLKRQKSKGKRRQRQNEVLRVQWVLSGYLQKGQTERKKRDRKVRQKVGTSIKRRRGSKNKTLKSYTNARCDRKIYKCNSKAAFLFIKKMLFDMNFSERQGAKWWKRQT